LLTLFLFLTPNCIANFDQPNISASKIANDSPEFYDPFGHKLPVDGYLPNEYLRNLKNSVLAAVEADRFLEKMKRKLLAVDSLRLNIIKGSETGVEDPNLDRLFGLIDATLRTANIPNIKNERWRMTGTKMPLAKEARLQPTIRFHHPSDTLSERDCLLLGSEGKGIQDSLEKCLIQLLAACGSGCIQLRNVGIGIEQAVTLGIAHAGNLVQFFGFYLLPVSFPVTVALTRPLSIGSQADLKEIATWCLRCSEHCMNLVHLISPITDVPATPTNQVTLRGQFFFKPIRSTLSEENQKIGTRKDIVKPDVSNRTLELNHMLTIFQPLSITADNQRFIDFPLGVVTVPYLKTNTEPRVPFLHNQELCKLLIDHVFAVPHFTVTFRPEDLDLSPLVVFPYLPVEEWSTRKPETSYVEGYTQELKAAVTFLNTAGVDHQDLRPANILWRVQGGRMRLKICDFEDSVLFGEQISSEYLSRIMDKNDYRYPFTRRYNGDLVQYGCARNNYYFRNIIVRWLNSGEPNFGDFASIAATRDKFVETFYNQFQSPNSVEDFAV
jgi:hypothetical protein